MKVIGHTAGYQVTTEVADSDRFFYVVTVTAPDGTSIQGTYEPLNPFETKDPCSPELADAITDYLMANNERLH